MARLAHTFATSEPLMTVELKAVINVVEVAHEEQKSADGCACPSFARVAMDDYDILRVSYIKSVNVRLHLRLQKKRVLTLEPSVAFLGDLIKEGEWRSMVIGPMIV